MFLLDDPANEREAVGMYAGAGEAEHDVAGPDFRSGQDLVPIDRANAEAGKVVISG